MNFFARFFLGLTGFLSAGQASNPFTLALTATYKSLPGYGEERLGYTLTVLHDGRVALIGGMKVGRLGIECFAETMILDVRTGTWISSAPIPSKRYDHAALALPDGRVAIVGGTDCVSKDSAGLQTVHIFDPKTDSWITPSPAPNPIKSPTIALLDDKTFIVAGRHYQVTPDGKAIDGRIFDISSNRWTGKIPLKTDDRGKYSGGTSFFAVSSIGLFSKGATVPRFSLPYTLSRLPVVSGLCGIPSGAGRGCPRPKRTSAKEVSVLEQNRRRTVKIHRLIDSHASGIDLNGLLIFVGSADFEPGSRKHRCKTGVMAIDLRSEKSRDLAPLNYPRCNPKLVKLSKDRVLAFLGTDTDVPAEIYDAKFDRWTKVETPKIGPNAAEAESDKYITGRSDTFYVQEFGKFNVEAVAIDEEHVVIISELQTWAGSSRKIGILTLPRF